MGDESTTLEENEADTTPDKEEEYEVVEGPFAVLAKTLDFIDVAWDHAVGKDDFAKMMTVVDKTLEVNDRYMAVQFTQEEKNERVEGSPIGYGFSAEINNSERPPNVKSG